MGKNTKIAWCDHTWNPWWGCEKIAPECALCYAATFANRLGFGGDNKPSIWGKDAERRFFGDAHWNEPLKWNTEAIVKDEFCRVFCASMADVFEKRDDLKTQRDRLYKLIEKATRLNWLLLTKRPDNIVPCIPEAWKTTPQQNVWFGTSAGCQKTAAENLPPLLSTPAAIRFVSAEPMLGELDLRPWLSVPDPNGVRLLDMIEPKKIHWVIVGGESGPGARPFDLAWARSVRDQCREAGVAFFMKQLGAKPVLNGQPYPISDKKGEVMADWPEDLRIQEFPR